MKFIVPILLTLMAFCGTNTLNYSTNSTKSTTVENQQYAPFAVVELFTSQGCSSCPPADEILRAYANAENVYPLSFHVTYWNRLGWQDKYSQQKFDERQYMYGNFFKLNSVYTPQMVINGVYETVGSRKNDVKVAIQNALNTPSKAAIELHLNKNKSVFELSYKLKGETKNADLNVFLVEKSIKTAVLRGENEGRTLYHDNVVRQFQSIELGDLTEGGTHFTTKEDWNIENCSVVAFLQDKNNLQIRAATAIK